jgi:hypothetical protein
LGIATRGYHARNHHNAEPGEFTFNWCVQHFADTARSTCRRSTCALASVRPDQSGMHTCGFCSQRRQHGCWDSVGLYPADYGRDATTEAGQQAFAATRPSGRGGMQGTKSRFRNGWRATLILQDSTVENSTRDGPSLGQTRALRNLVNQCHTSLNLRPKSLSGHFRPDYKVF